jgi:broad specificity phosphatase PhoE
MLGEFEMLTRPAIAKRFPDEPARWEAAGQYHYRPPGGESFGDIALRLSAFLDDLNRDHAGQRVVVVAHDAVVLMMRSVIETLSWDELAAVAATGHVQNASVTRFDGSSGRLLLDRYNTVDHLA